MTISRISRLSGHVSVLQLRFLILDGQADWPVVQVLVDGREAFVDRLPGWQGFDPADMLADQSPLLPEDGGHRVAVYRCSCGIAGCGVIAPDGDRPDGRPWPIRDLHFDRGQYIAEVRRASGDRSWETPRRITARLVADGLRDRDAACPPDLRLQWAAPARDGGGVMLSFENRPASEEFFVQRVLSLTSDHSEPELAARDILDQLQAVPAGQWNSRFGWQRSRR